MNVIPHYIVRCLLRIESVKMSNLDERVVFRKWRVFLLWKRAHHKPVLWCHRCYSRCICATEQQAIRHPDKQCAAQVIVFIRLCSTAPAVFRFFILFLIPYLLLRVIHGPLFLNPLVPARALRISAMVFVSASSPYSIFMTFVRPSSCLFHMRSSSVFHTGHLALFIHIPRLASSFYYLSHFRLLLHILTHTFRPQIDLLFINIRDAII